MMLTVVHIPIFLKIICSWIFCSSATDAKFEDYGVEYNKDDVIGAFLDLESDPVDITFTKNGETQGSAFQVPKAQLEGKALFPHVW
jgi:heterogeneous nuclear ribonucleoprotein U-like protein 1